MRKILNLFNFQKIPEPSENQNLSIARHYFHNRLLRPLALKAKTNEINRSD